MSLGLLLRGLISTLAFVSILPTDVHGVELPSRAAFGYPPALPGAKVETYKQAGDVKLAVYIFSPKSPPADEPRPAIIFFFGGGWTGGSPEQFRYQCEYLASRGLVAVTADYRVASRHGVKAVDCVRDAADAVRYLRVNAARLGIDPAKLVAAGGSAGGHLAACLGTLAEIPGDDGPHRDVSYRPDAMVLFNPALNLADTEQGLALLAERTGVDPLAISPFQYAGKQTPPTLLLFGTADKMTESAREFTAKLQQLGARCELELYADLPHGFFNVGRNGNQSFLATLERADRFLESLGYVSGAPQVRKFFDN